MQLSKPIKPLLSGRWAESRWNLFRGSRGSVNIWEVTSMQESTCQVCGYVYDPEQGDPDSGIEPGTPFEDIPEDWICPICGATKDQFEPK